MGIDELLEGNARFVTEEFLTDPDHYQPLAGAQNPDVLWIGCADSRVSVDTITQTRPGTIFVHRNVANVVSFNDNNFGAVLAYALEHLGIREIAVCGHYFCGGLAALSTEIENPVIHDWLNVASHAVALVRARPDFEELDETRRMEILTEYHVRRQMQHLEQFALVRQVRRSGSELRIRGLVYDFRTGKLNNVDQPEPVT